ncbi:hypothetical protein DESC_500088 [Desulfosarcina cetonica]|nr:hypothetical protein DESC_500088 [Desulfosarcina cetonica]
MERVPVFQMLRSVIGGGRQFTNDGQKETGDRIEGSFLPTADQPTDRCVLTMGLMGI